MEKKDMCSICFGNNLDEQGMCLDCYAADTHQNSGHFIKDKKCEKCGTKFIKLEMQVNSLIDGYQHIASVEGCPVCFVPALQNVGVKIVPAPINVKPDVTEDEILSEKYCPFCYSDIVYNIKGSGDAIGLDYHHCWFCKIDFSDRLLTKEEVNDAKTTEEVRSKTG